MNYHNHCAAMRMPREHSSRKVVSWTTELPQPFCSNAHATGVHCTEGGLVDFCITTTTLHHCACHGNTPHGRWSRGSFKSQGACHGNTSEGGLVNPCITTTTLHHCACHGNTPHGRWSRGFLNYHNHSAAMRMPREYLALKVVSWIPALPQPLCIIAHATGILRKEGGLVDVCITTTPQHHCACSGNTGTEGGLVDL